MVELVRFGHFSDYPHDDLGTQPKSRAGLGVHHSVQFELTEGAFTPGDVADRVGRRVGGFEGPRAAQAVARRTAVA